MSVLFTGPLELQPLSDLGLQGHLDEGVEGGKVEEGGGEGRWESRGGWGEGVEGGGGEGRREGRGSV